VAANPKGIAHRHRVLKWLLGASLGVAIALGAAIDVAWRNAEPILRAEVVKQLEEHFHARVELDGFQLSLAHGLSVEGKGLRIWPPQQGAKAVASNAGQQPLIRLKKFRFRAPLHLKPGAPVRIPVLVLEGLYIDVPPQPEFGHQFGAQPEEANRTPLVRFEVASIECVDAHLRLETDKPGKSPLEFVISHLKLTDRQTDGSMQFDAEVTNPRPAGEIFTSGRLGPWAVEDPGETPLNGQFRFEHADLAVFKGIAGILSSKGQYEGVLRDLTVDGKTETPDFRLTRFGTAMPLHTVFHAHVDGTNGDTLLQPVNARLGQSSFVAEGKIVRVLPGTAPNGAPTPGGHEIALNVKVNGGRMEDFLRLTSKDGKPLLTGTVTLRTYLEIPPGPVPLDEKLKLKGNFLLEDVQFTSQKIQDRLCDLSLRGLGKPNEARHNENADVRSTMRSDFTMAYAVLTFPNLTYTVPGAQIDLAGTYGVRGGALDFNGTAKTKATISQMVGGWKGELLKPADRFFKKDGAGAEFPIHLAGTRDAPEFGIDAGRFRHTSPQIP
jgi:hypothetical protein